MTEEAAQDSDGESSDGSYAASTEENSTLLLNVITQLLQNDDYESEDAVPGTSVSVDQFTKVLEFNRFMSRRLQLIDGKVHIKRHVTKAHEVVHRRLAHHLVNQCHLFIDFGRTRRYFNQSSLTADSSLLHSLAPNVFYGEHCCVTIYIEVHVTESSSTMDKAAQTYLTQESTALVLNVYLTSTESNQIDQLYLAMYERVEPTRDGGLIAPSRVVSFGASERRSTKQALCDNTGFDEAAISRVTLGDPQSYRVTIPAEVIWRSVIGHENHEERRDIVLDLYDVMHVLWIVKCGDGAGNVVKMAL